LELSPFFFRPFGAYGFRVLSPTACAVGCILSPLRGWIGIGADLSIGAYVIPNFIKTFC
jgi:hypothetical protein